MLITISFLSVNINSFNFIRSIYINCTYFLKIRENKDDIHLKEKMLNESVQCDDSRNIVLNINKNSSNNDTSYYNGSINSLDMSLSMEKHENLIDENNFKHDIQQWAL